MQYQKITFELTVVTFEVYHASKALHQIHICFDLQLDCFNSNIHTFCCVLLTALISTSALHCRCSVVLVFITTLVSALLVTALVSWLSVATFWLSLAHTQPRLDTEHEVMIVLLCS